jgi:predicted phosphodiesterase
MKRERPEGMTRREWQNHQAREARRLASEIRVGKPLGQRIAEAGSASSEGERSLMSERDRKYDPDASTEDLIGDLRGLQELNPTKYITRTFYRKEGKYSEKTWNARFGTFLEFRRQAGLELHRGGHRLERDIALHASRDRYRGFYEIEILPYVGTYEKTHAATGMKRVLVLSDIHDRNADRFVLDVAIATADRVKPDIIVLNGDVFEFAEFSRFDKDPRTIDIRGAFEFVREQVFRKLRMACPDAQIDMIIGNHDARVLRHMADRTPYLVPLMDLMGITLSKLFGLEEFQINLVNKADFAAYLPKEMREEMLRNYKVYFNTLLVGHHPANYGICSVAAHTHKPAYQSHVNELTGSYFQLTTGCISKIDFNYVEGLNNYAQSFALFHIDPILRECVPEHIVFSQHLAVVGGIIYRRSEV